MRALMILASCGAFAFGGYALLNSGTAQAQDPAKEESHEHSELEESMEKIKAGVRKLRRSLKSAESDADSLTAIAGIQAAALAAKGESPRMTGRLPEADQAAFVVSYRKQMIELLQSMLTLESALLDGDREAASAAFDAMRGLEDPAHARFIQDW